MEKKSIQEINAGSMADIAFLLLIFFLVTTTMDNDIGIIRKLPPMVDVPPTITRKRNTLYIWVNRNNTVMAKGEVISLNALKPIAKEFIQNPEHKKELPEIKIINVPEIGEVYTTTQHIISLMNDRGTNYETYIAVQNELTRAYNELRDEFAIQHWKTHYADLDKAKKKSVDMVYPLRISEAEPVETASLD